MDSTISIWVNHRNLHISADMLESLCPGLLNDFAAGTISFEAITSQVYNTLQGTINPPLKRSTVEKVLGKVFEIMGSHFPFFGGGNPEKRIRKIVEDRLGHDMPPFDGTGLRQSRHAFLVICSFAKLTLSQPIANEMSKIIRNRGHDISNWEDGYYMREWQLGIRALSELSVDQITFGTSPFSNWPPSPPLLPLMLAPHHTPFDNYYRGRNPLRLPAPLFPRARSLGHGRSHGMQLALPRLSNTAWNSPILSPSLRPGSYYDDLGQLHYQQEEMNWKLDGIDQKLDHLLRW
jgi:hypothetical protein